MADLPLRAKDPLTGHRFRVEFQSLVVAGFSECSGLHLETETFEYREGGRNGYKHRFCGPAHQPPLVLKRGLSLDPSLWLWYQDVVALRGFARRSGSIILLDSSGAEALRWNFEGAYPIKWNGPDFRAESAAVAFESIEFAHRGFVLRPPLSA